MKNITLSASDELIDAARARAQAEHTTLNAEFRRWLEAYTGQEGRAAAYRAFMDDVSTRFSLGGRKFTRDEMNER